MTDVTDDMPTYGTSRRSAEIDKLATALAKAQGAMGNAEKTGENPAFKRDGKATKYATLTAVLDAVRKPLSENGLSVLQWPRTNGQGVEIETHLLHESGQYMRDVLWLPCPQMTPHAAASLISYLRRYSLMSVVGVAPAESEEDDGNAATDAHKPGAPGSASGGTDYRPAGPRRMSTNGMRMANDDAHLISDRDKGTNGKPPAPDERAPKVKAWVDKTIEDLKLVGHTAESRKQFLDVPKRVEWIQFLEAQFPAEHDRLFDAVNALIDAERGRVS